MEKMEAGFSEAAVILCSDPLSLSLVCLLCCLSSSRSGLACSLSSNPVSLYVGLSANNVCQSVSRLLVHCVIELCFLCVVLVSVNRIVNNVEVWQWNKLN